ncbi:MAG: hypothetical protein AB1540_16595 [Bdellovibrionota bacterium]
MKAIVSLLAGIVMFAFAFSAEAGRVTNKKNQHAKRGVASATNPGASVKREGRKKVREQRRIARAKAKAARNKPVTKTDPAAAGHMEPTTPDLIEGQTH